MMNIRGVTYALAALVFPCLSLSAAETIQHGSQLNLQAIYLEKPADTEFYNTTTQDARKVLWRENLVFKPDDALMFHCNGYLMAQDIGQNDDMDKFILQSADPRNRTTKLERHFYHTKQRDALWTFDRLDLALKVGGLRTQFGRFPIDLARTYVFRPNDFFGPFRSSQFDRSHKLGVDALEFALPVAPLGELKWIGVAGYASTSVTIQNPWQQDNRFSRSQSSSLLYYGNTWHGMYGALFGGKLAEDGLYGATVEGEVQEAFGYHVDIHHRLNVPKHQASTLAAVALDRQFVNDITLQVEFFYNGDGATSGNSWSAPSVADPYHPTPYRSMHYGAFVISYKLFDLTEIKWLVQNNLDDRSGITTFFLKKPVTQNLDLTLNINLKGGTPPDRGRVRSEFGVYPHTFSLEMSAYF